MNVNNLNLNGEDGLAPEGAGDLGDLFGDNAGENQDINGNQGDAQDGVQDDGQNGLPADQGDDAEEQDDVPVQVERIDPAGNIAILTVDALVNILDGAEITHRNYVGVLPKNFVDFNDFATFKGDEDVSESLLQLFLMYGAAFEIINSTRLADPTYFADEVEKLETENTLRATPEDKVATNKEVIKLFKHFNDYFRVFKANAYGYLITLAACYQVSPLNANNIKSYLASKGIIDGDNDGTLALVRCVAARLPKIINIPELREYLEASEYFKYHTTVSSSGALAYGMYQALGDFTVYLLTEEEIDIIQRAAAAPSNATAQSEISDKIKVMTKAYLQAFDINVGSWYQGDRAVRSFPAATYEAYKNVFNAIKRINLDNSQLNKAKDISSVIAALPDAIFTGNDRDEHVERAAALTQQGKMRKLRRANRAALRKYKRDNGGIEGYVPVTLEEVSSDEE